MTDINGLLAEHRSAIFTERRRQIDVEGYDHYKDSGKSAQLRAAGEAYLEQYRGFLAGGLPFSYEQAQAHGWPWGEQFWKPTPQDPLRTLIKGGALLLAADDAEGIRLRPITKDDPDPWQPLRRRRCTCGVAFFSPDSPTAMRVLDPVCPKHRVDRYPSLIFTEERGSVIMRGHGLTEEEVLVNMIGIVSHTPGERLVTEEVFLVFKPRIKNCRDYDGWGCDQNGEWHGHWFPVKENDDPATHFTLAHWTDQD